MTGIIKYWRADRGFGFIKPTDGSRDLFAHAKRFVPRLLSGAEVPTGTPVEFTVDDAVDTRGPSAVDIRIIRPDGLPADDDAIDGWST